jgi:beta-galactosidase/beta-glucuronidase
MIVITIVLPVGWNGDFIRKGKTKNGVMLFNEQAIKFKGVNRHDSDPKTGYVISREKRCKIYA